MDLQGVYKCGVLRNGNRGVRDGIPIFLGYLAVSFAFGMQAASAGLTWLEATVMSVSNLTSAGQFAALGIIASGAGYGEMALTQLVVNLRYCLMSCALSQKLDRSYSMRHRFFMALRHHRRGLQLSACRESPLSPYYTYGLISSAMPGWGLGTLLGVLSGTLLPGNVVSALAWRCTECLSPLWFPRPRRSARGPVGHFDHHSVSVGFSYIPALSSGFRIILVTILVAAFAAWRFPIKEVERDVR